MSTLFKQCFIFITFISAISTSKNDPDRLEKLLKNDRLQMDEMMTSYIPIVQLWDEIWQNGQLSMSEKYNSLYTYPPKMSFNHLIGSIDDDIEVILSENDKELTQQLTIGFEDELADSLKDIDFDRYNAFIRQMIGGNGPIKQKKSKTFDINGASSDYRYVSAHTPSTGMNAEYWSVSSECIKHKGCNVYPHFRVIHKTKSFDPSSKSLSFSCHDIMTLLFPQIFECIDHFGGINKCPLIIDQGHFRWVFKAKIPQTENEFVVIKMMKQNLKESARDFLRSIRESIVLYYLRREELEFMNAYGTNAQLFLSNFNETRAFPFVYELGHCVYPHYISVSHYYSMNVQKFIKKGYAQKATIKQLVKMSLDIAKGLVLCGIDCFKNTLFMSIGIELLHNVRGGPFHHTDIRADQFMIDELGNVLINDFNRGKFQQYFFANYDYGIAGDGIKKCNFCPHAAHGSNRAPEELMSKNLDETIDIYSAAMIIWSLFSGTDVFENLSGADLEYVVYDTARRPNMPSNMPYAMKEVIRAAVSQDPKNRPKAKEFRRMIQSVYDNVDAFTRGSQKLQSEFVRKERIFADLNNPRVSKDFPEFLDSDDGDGAE